MRSGTTVDLIGVWGTSHSDVFVVGASGTILHFDGGTWSPMNAGTDGDLYLVGVWGADGADVFAVGDGEILHYDGAAWTISAKSPLYSGLSGVWGVSGTDVFAVGIGKILHYDGSSWSNAPGGEKLEGAAVWGASGSDVFAAGNSTNGAAVWHYDGSSWGASAIPGYDTYPGDASFSDVWGASGSDVYVVGYTLDSSNDGIPLMLHFDGAAWHVFQYGPAVYSMWGTSSGDIFAVGAGLAVHFDGNSWHSISAGYHGGANAVWASSYSDAYAVGNNGLILHCDAETP